MSPGSRGRTLILRCDESRRDLVMSGLTVEIERSFGRPLDSERVGGRLTCAGTG